MERARMSIPRSTIRRRRRRAALLLGCLVATGVLAGVLLTGPSAVGGNASAAPSPGEIVPQTDDAVPARGVTLFGSSPSEAPNEVWGIGRSHGATTIVRYATGTGWSVAPGPLTTGGAPLEGFELDHPEAGKYAQPSPLAGEVTPDGGAVLLGTVPGSSASARRDTMLVRDPGGAFSEVALPPGSEEAHGAGEVTLESEEMPFGENRPPLLAALEEPGSAVGALLVPVFEHGGSGVEGSVLHWNGTAWSREPIEIPSAGKGEFHVLAIGASSPGNAWLLAALSSSSYPSGSVRLFRRHLEGGEASWRPVAVGGGEAGGPLSVPVGSGSQQFTIAGATQSQILTVTSDGLWLDGLRADADASTTMYLTSTGEDEAQVQHAWCLLPASSSAEGCAGQLPEALPASGGRSYAWADPSRPDGRRVITGFPAGVSLRLEAQEENGQQQFAVQPALGGTPHHDVGGVYGSAFASDREGWLGQELLPVHLTEERPQNRLTPHPVPFRKALLAIAPAPGQPIGAANSKALAVGDNGEVARYDGPGTGWVPESLLGPGGKFETPRLRSVAWPRPNRAYAVGDFSASVQSQMWLWRGETGLWEPDPATPENFRGNLLGIAFDSAEPSRGYAVGEEGVLLSDGKTWQQEALPAEPACAPIHAGNSEEAARCSTWSDVTFTAVAFAGSEAIVAYRILPSISSPQYRGGLVVNSGSGWHVDQGAAAALGEDTPYALAALPDGGAAFSASGLSEGSLIFERQAAGGTWQPTATPFPGRTAGSLSLFREGTGLRTIATGVVPDTAKLESEANVPVGQPPELLRPYPIESSPEQGVLRQTASGWSDEEHELNNAKEVPGEYTFYDTAYQPDPIQAVLVSADGAEGWAVGGTINARGHALLDTSDVERYRGAEGGLPEGFGTAPITVLHSGSTTFAVGGGARCEAPCAAMSDAGIGPDRWLMHAFAVAAQVPVSAFLYTGPRVTTGATAGPATVPVPWLAEEKRYHEVLADGGIAADPTASETDVEPTGTKTEQAFKQAFPLPFEEACSTAGCSSYALSPTVSPVHVIELDEGEGAAAGQLARLRTQLAGALVIGSSDIAKLAGEHVGWAVIAARELVEGKAAAYLFDAPEENVTEPISWGASSIQSYGSGTLGYVNFSREETITNFHGASGFMLIEVHPGSAVGARLIPSIEELAIEAQQGTLLRRSRTAYFQGLGRRPRSGNRAHNGQTEPETDPYVQIPAANCLGAVCAKDEFPEPDFTFTSSDPETGIFVEPAEGTSSKLTPKLNAAGNPISDSHSGLFCALNAGHTTVTLTSGGLSASLQVEVQAGSVARPCGTTTLKEVPHEASAPAPAPPPGTAPAAAPPSTAPTPLVPAPPAPAAIAAKPLPPVASPFFVNAPLAAFVPAFVPPPVPTPARPTPPSGTSPVSSQVEAAEREEEEEAAPESASAEASAYRSHEHEPTPLYLLGVVTLAAFAGASVRRGRRRREVRIAPASISTMRAQQRMSQRRRRW
jgi:hypothetical protein